MIVFDKRFLIINLLVCFTILLSSKVSEAYPAGLAGFADAPGDPASGYSFDCTICHEPEGQQYDGYLLLWRSSRQIIVDDVVPIYVYFDGDSLGRWGFNFIALDDATGEPVGELIAGTGSQLLTSGKGWDYLSHTFAGTQNTTYGYPGWLVGWQAPSEPVENVSFYATFNAANGDLDDDGDTIFVSQAEASVSTGVTVCNEFAQSIIDDIFTDSDFLCSDFDLNDDGGVGLDDMSVMLSSLGTVNDNDADLNGDGGVGFDDFGMFLSVMGALN